MAPDSAMMTLPILPMDLRNSRAPSRFLASEQASGRAAKTLLGLRMMRLLPMAAVISFSKVLRAWKAMSARSSPVVRATRETPRAGNTIGGAGGRTGMVAGRVGAPARADLAQCAATTAAAPLAKVVLRKSRRECPKAMTCSCPQCGDKEKDMTLPAKRHR